MHLIIFYLRYGKTTLLRHVAQRAFPVPPTIDILYCEQEVVADDFTAVESVLKADLKRTNLLNECKRLEDLFQAGSVDAQDKLNEVYAELRATGADSAEPRARRILAGLGFSKEMQVINMCNVVCFLVLFMMMLVLLNN